jgi:Ca2+-binding RTX toxin-like protein
MVENAATAVSTSSSAGSAYDAVPVVTFYTAKTPDNPAERSAGLKALLQKHAGENAPQTLAERAESLKDLLKDHIHRHGGEPPLMPSEQAALRSQAFKELLQKHAQATGEAQDVQMAGTEPADDRVDDGKAITLDLSHYIDKSAGFITIKLQLSNPQAASLAAPLAQNIEHIADNDHGIVTLRGDAEELYFLLAHLRLISSAKPDSFRLDVAVTEGTHSSHHYVPLIFDAESSRLVAMHSAGGQYSSGHAQIPNLEWEFLWQSEEAEHAEVIVRRYASSDSFGDAASFGAASKAGSSLHHGYGLDSIEINSGHNNAGGGNNGNDAGGGKPPPPLTPPEEPPYVPAPPAPVTERVTLTASTTDRLFGGTEFSGIAANWHVTDTLEGGGQHSLTITDGLVDVDLGIFTHVSGINHFYFQGDAAHRFTVTQDYLSRTALSGSLVVHTDALGSTVLFDASTLDNSINVSLAGGGASDTLLAGAGDDTLSGGADDVMDGGAGTDRAEITSGTLNMILDGAAILDAIEYIDLTGSDAAHNIVVQNGYYAGLDGNTLTINASGISNGVQVTATALSAANAIAVLASNGDSTLKGGAGSDSLSFAGQTAGMSISLATGIATQGATTYSFEGFEQVTGSAFEDSLYGSAHSDVLIGGAGDDHMYAATANGTYAFSNLVLHLDATDGSSLTIGAGVSQWSDKSGSGNDATQANATSQPDTGGDISGQNAIVFDGSNDYFNVADSADINLNAQNERSVFVQFETGADVTSRQVIYEQGGGSNGFAIYIVGGKLYVGGWKSSGAAFGVFLSGDVMANTEYSAGFAFDFPNGEFRGYLDGASLGTLAVGQAQGGHSGDIGVGALNNAGYFHDIGADNGSTAYYFQGAIAELLNYSYALTDAEQQSLFDYFTAKYSYGSGNGDTFTGGEGADVFHWEDGNRAIAGSADHISDFNDAEGDRISFAAITLPSFVLSGQAAFSGVAGQIIWSQEGVDTRVQLDRDGDGTTDLDVVLDNMDAASLNEEAFLLPAMNLSGTIANDTLSGANADDTLTGGFGNDALYGKAGNDSIVGGGSGNYTPVDGAFWFDASDAAERIIASGVQQVNDKFGSTNDASQASAGARPQVEAAGLNGLDTLRFDGVNDYLVVPNAADLNTSNQTGRSIFVTFETGADITSRQFLYEQGGSTNGFNLYIYNGELYVGAWRGSGGNFGYWHHTAIEANTAYTAGFVFDFGGANSFNGYLSGVEFGNGSISIEQAAHTDGIGIGAMNGSSRVESGTVSGTNYYFNGEIAEMVNYDRALDTEERQNIESYLSQKWATPFSGSLTDDDSLYGGAGNDTITGGMGQDTMAGGAGNDVFLFLQSSDSTTANPDRIIDFVRGEDVLDVSALGYTSASDFTITNNGSITTVDDGAGFTIELNGALVLDDSDFVF